MKSQKILVLLGVGALCAAGFAWREKRMVSATRASLSLLDERVASTRRDIERLEENLAALAEERAKMQVPGENRFSPGGIPQPANPPETSPAKTAQLLTSLVQDLRERETSEGQRRQLAWHGARLGESYQSLVEALGLGSAEAQRFHAAMLRREEEKMDILAVARQHGLTLMDKIVGGLWSQAETECQNSQKELLGEEGYRRFQEYERTVSVRDVVRSFIGMTTMAGHPLSSQQAEQLVRIFAATTEGYLKGGTAPRSHVDWDAGLEHAKAIVSAQQLQLISSYEPAGGTGGLAWMRFNKLLGTAQEADRVARNSQMSTELEPRK